MSDKKPTKLTVEYDDGSSLSVDFAALPGLLQFDLLRQPFALDMDEVKGGSGKFVILEWEDGWREVYQVSDAAEALGRYYVVSRNEDIGRVAVTTAEGYPDYFEIIRRPLSVKRIALGDTFTLAAKETRREGKKTEQFYDLATDGDLVADIGEALKAAAAEEGIDLAGVLTSGDEEAKTKLETLRKRMKLVAGQREQDVLAFMAALLRGSD